MANSTVIIIQCLVIMLALFVGCTQGRSLQRIHNRHHSGGRNSVESEMEREMMEDQERIPVRHSRGKHTRHRVKFDRLIHDDSEEDNRILRISENHKGLSELTGRFHAIRKRYNGATDNIGYETMTEEDEADFNKSQARSVNNESNEVEIKQAQNISLCNYTVVDIPDPSSDNTRIPKKLFHVKCNHAGSTCRGSGTHCCLQTYSTLEVSYGDGITEMIKILTGCVCARSLYGKIDQYTPKVPISF